MREFITSLIISAILVPIVFAMHVDLLPNEARSYDPRVISGEARQNWSRKEIDCLARNIYWEAAFEDSRGKELVAHVTMNRVDDGRFPNTICKVVLQHKAFSWTLPPSKANPSFKGPNARPDTTDNSQWDESLRIAKLVAERNWWWHYTKKKTPKYRTTGQLLDEVRNQMMHNAGGEFGHSLDILPKEEVAGVLWYLNPHITKKKIVRAWERRWDVAFDHDNHRFFRAD